MDCMIGSRNFRCGVKNNKISACRRKIKNQDLCLAFRFGFAETKVSRLTKKAATSTTLGCRGGGSIYLYTLSFTRLCEPSVCNRGQQSVAERESEESTHGI
jgi:hypothetical protein